MNFNKAKDYIYRTARPLDLVRWQYLFENGSQENVLNILKTYQNEDGGFGHGLEVDCWNPHSSPIQTWVAAKIIKEINLQDGSHPMIQGILHYLETTDHFNGHIWLNTIPTNNDYPHASWWDYDETQEQSYNPTAFFVGFIIKYAKQESALYQTACCLAREAYDYLENHYPLESMHTVACFVDMFEYLHLCQFQDIINIKEFEELLSKQIKYILTQDVSIWISDYVCKPSLFIGSKESAFYADNKEICQLECEFITKTQEDDGSWNITWQWDHYLEQWFVAKNWWKTDLIIKNVKFYKAIYNENR